MRTTQNSTDAHRRSTAPASRSAGSGQVTSHDQRRTSIERKRRHQHPPVADRHQLKNTKLRLTLQQIDRVKTRGANSKTAWLERGTSARAALPRENPTATLRCATPELAK